jgi:AcrR family transcriptional regulator
LDAKTNLVEKTGMVVKDEIVKADIINAAEKLFQQFGLRKTTMEDIAKALGKGKSTLYYYYTNKEEIFDAVVMKEMWEVFGNTKKAVEEAHTAAQKLQAFAIAKIGALQQKSNLYGIVSGEIKETHRCFDTARKEYYQQEVKLVAGILKYGVETGEFNNVIAKDIDVLPFVIVSAFAGLGRDLFTQHQFPGVETRMDSIVNILVNGLKERKPIAV